MSLGGEAFGAWQQHIKGILEKATKERRSLLLASYCSTTCTPSLLAPVRALAP